jgi:hypothetical protein
MPRRKYRTERDRPPSAAEVAQMRARAEFRYRLFAEDGAPSWDEVWHINAARIHIASCKLGLITQKQLHARLRKMKWQPERDRQSWNASDVRSAGTAFRLHRRAQGAGPLS